MTDTLDPSQALRMRLLLTLGLSLTGGCWALNCKQETQTTTVSLDALLLDTGDSGATGDTSNTTDSGDTGGSTVDTCPTDAKGVSELFSAAGVLCRVVEPVLVKQSGRDCTYEHTCWTCCGYGRPYLDASGTPVEAETRPEVGWTDSAQGPNLETLTAAERLEIGHYWRKNARAEHSSVAGFHRFALDLLAHGAPLDLVARAQRAAAQELRHAIGCFTLASSYLNETTGPAPMPMGGQAPIASSLAELAAWTARDGAIGETMAAYLAGRALTDTTDPAVRAVLAEIVRDETEHAELAWATLRWALETGGEEVREAIRAVFAGLGDPRPHELAWTPRMAMHGVPSPERERAEAKVCVTRVILPVAEALVAMGRGAEVDGGEKRGTTRLSDAV